MKTRIEIKETAKAAFYAQRNPSVVMYLVYVLLAMVLTGATWGIASFLLLPVLIVTMSGFYLRIYRGQAQTLSECFASAFDGYLRKLGGYLWMGLQVFLWSLLFVIPGIVAALAYSMTPYILAEYPQVSATDAARISKKITNGYKADIFVAGLSFLGWELLSTCTFGILEVLFVGPYREITFGGIYEELKNNALNSGTLNWQELSDSVVR